MNAENVLVGIGIAAFTGLVVGVWLLEWYFEKNRTERMLAFAAANGFTPDPDLRGFLASMGAYRLFNQGRRRQLGNLIRSQRGDDRLAIGDYEYTESGTKSPARHHTICVVQSPGLHVPHFFARRRVALFEGLFEAVGGPTVDFDDDPVFSKAYAVHAAGSHAELRRLFNERVRSVLSGLSTKNLEVEGRDGTLLFHYGSRRLGTERINELIEDSLAVRRAMG